MLFVVHGALTQTGAVLPFSNAGSPPFAHGFSNHGMPIGVMECGGDTIKGRSIHAHITFTCSRLPQCYFATPVNSVLAWTRATAFWRFELVLKITR